MRKFILVVTLLCLLSLDLQEASVYAEMESLNVDKIEWNAGTNGMSLMALFKANDNKGNETLVGYTEDSNFKIHLIGIDANSGEVKWRKVDTGTIRPKFSNDGYIYSQRNDKTQKSTFITVLNPHTGKEMWKIKISDEIFDVIPTSNGGAYVFSHIYKGYYIDKTAVYQYDGSGKQVKKYILKGPVSNGLHDVRGDYVLVALESGRKDVYSLQSGLKLFTLKDNAQFTYQLSGGTLIRQANKYKENVTTLTAYDIKGKIKWKKTMPYDYYNDAKIYVWGNNLLVQNGYDDLMVFDSAGTLLTKMSSIKGVNISRYDQRYFIVRVANEDNESSLIIVDGRTFESKKKINQTFTLFNLEKKEYYKIDGFNLKRYTQSD